MRRLPEVWSGSTMMVPWWRWMMSRVMARPRPTPPVAPVRASSRRTKRSKQDQVVGVAGQIQRLGAGLRPRHLVALGGERLPQAITQGDVVLDHQDPSATITLASLTRPARGGGKACRPLTLGMAAADRPPRTVATVTCV